MHGCEVGAARATAARSGSTSGTVTQMGDRVFDNEILLRVEIT